MISKRDDIPFTIIPQSCTRCSIISTITLSDEDFDIGDLGDLGSQADYDEYDEDDEEDLEEIEATIERMVMDMYQRKSAISTAPSETTNSDGTSEHDRFGSITGPRTSELLLQSVRKPERKPSVGNINLSIHGSSQHIRRESQVLHQSGEGGFDRMPHLPSRRPSQSISRTHSRVSDQTSLVE